MPGGPDELGCGWSTRGSPSTATKTGHLEHSARSAARRPRRGVLRGRHHRPCDPARPLRAADEHPTNGSSATRSGSPTDLLQDDEGVASERSAATCVTASSRCSTPRRRSSPRAVPARAYRPTTNGTDRGPATGRQAYRIGAHTVDMEMVQYHPTTLAGNGLPDHRGRARRGGLAAERRGRAVHDSLYAPNKVELASRDVVSRAEQTEINEGRGVPPDGHGGARRDQGAPPAHAGGAARDRQHRQGLRRRRHHPRADPLSSRASTTHGRRSDRRRWGQTTIAGLYAAGEVACVSVHGGNRLGANSLLDTLIFGRRVR